MSPNAGPYINHLTHVMVYVLPLEDLTPPMGILRMMTEEFFEIGASSSVYSGQENERAKLISTQIHNGEDGVVRMCDDV